MPLDVFKLYKSTATGKNTKSGAGKSPFTFKLAAGLSVILLYIFYMVFFFFDDDSVKVPVSSNNAKTTQIQPYSKANQAPKEAVKKDIQNSVKGLPTIDDVSFRDASVSSIITGNNFVNLPYSASAIYINGMTTVRYGKHRVSRDYIFTVYIRDEAFSVNSDTLTDMGYKIFYKKNCLVELRSDIGSNYVYCEPDKLLDNAIEHRPVANVSLLN